MGRHANQEGKGGWSGLVRDAPVSWTDRYLARYHSETHRWTVVRRWYNPVIRLSERGLDGDLHMACKGFGRAIVICELGPRLCNSFAVSVVDSAPAIRFSNAE